MRSSGSVKLKRHFCITLPLSCLCNHTHTQKKCPCCRILRYIWILSTRGSTLATKDTQSIVHFVIGSGIKIMNHQSAAASFGRAERRRENFFAWRDFGVIILSLLKGETFLQPWKFAEKSQIMLIYADFPVKIAPPSALIIINMTAMQTDQIFRVSIREDEVPFCVSFFFRVDKTTLAFLFLNKKKNLGYVPIFWRHCLSFSLQKLQRRTTPALGEWLQDFRQTRLYVLKCFSHMSS